jgi:hypothetical protein
MAPPLLVVAAVSAGLGLCMSALVLDAGHTDWLPPAPGYWAALLGGLFTALLIAASAAFGLLGRLTSPQHSLLE